MKPTLMKTLALLGAMVVLSGCMGMNRTQQNTAIGAGIGGAAGYMIGGDTGSTLGGAALGGVIGSQVR